MNTKITKEQLQKADEQIQKFDSRFHVELSIDEEYLILKRGQLDVFHDSACEDTYDPEMAVSVFKETIEYIHLFEDAVKELE